MQTVRVERQPSLCSEVNRSSTSAIYKSSSPIHLYQQSGDPRELSDPNLRCSPSPRHHSQQRESPGGCGPVESSQHQILLFAPPPHPPHAILDRLCGSLHPQRRVDEPMLALKSPCTIAWYTFPPLCPFDTCSQFFATNDAAHTYRSNRFHRCGRISPRYKRRRNQARILHYHLVQITPIPPLSDASRSSVSCITSKSLSTAPTLPPLLARRMLQLFEKPATNKAGGPGHQGRRHGSDPPPSEATQLVVVQ